MVQSIAAFCLAASLLFQSATLSQANAFLRSTQKHVAEQVAEADIQSSLLAAVEDSMGAGSASRRLSELEDAMRPLFTAMEKNAHGNLGHAHARYLLHRQFLMRRGWSVKGLDPAGGAWNKSTAIGILSEQAPSYIQDIFEQQLGEKGLGLHELAVMAATIEHLIHKEAISRLGQVLKLHDLQPTDHIEATNADDVLDTYMMGVLLGEGFSNYTKRQVKAVKKQMQNVYANWESARSLGHETWRKVVAERRPGMGATAADFATLTRAVEKVGEDFGHSQQDECRQMKELLLTAGDRRNGRIELSRFYGLALGGAWHFEDSVAYLRELGALDETVSEKPKVIIANYILSQSNCIASSGYYDICCLDECDGVLRHLEDHLAAPGAAPARILEVLASFSSPSVGSAAVVNSSATLRVRLDEIASQNGGVVPIHGRLFAQWLHHAFPHACEYPHLSGTTQQHTPDQFVVEKGMDASATKAEMEHHSAQQQDEAVAPAPEATSATSLEAALHEEPAIPWSDEEELLVCRPEGIKMLMGPQATKARGLWRQLSLLAAAVALAAGLTRTAMASKSSLELDASAAAGLQKILV